MELQEKPISRLQGSDWQLIENSRDVWSYIEHAFGNKLNFIRAAVWYCLPWRNFGLIARIEDGEIVELYLYDGIPYLGKLANRIFWRNELGLPQFIAIPRDWRQQLSDCNCSFNPTEDRLQISCR